jgi:hypothetical protein
MGLLEEHTDSFVELNLHERAKLPTPIKKGNIVKAVNTAALGIDPTTDASSQNQEPEVIIHQTGEKIESIEFRCPCGKHTDVKIEYDGD